MFPGMTSDDVIEFPQWKATIGVSQEHPTVVMVNEQVSLNTLVEICNIARDIETVINSSRDNKIMVCVINGAPKEPYNVA